MPITLSVQTYREEAPPLPMARRFDQLGGAIGRIAGNDLVLDDPGKYISRVHARVEYRDGGYYLLDVGSNPSMVNGRPAGPGRPVLLQDGDQVLIGDYLLAVSLTPEAQAAPALQPFAPMSAPAAPQPTPPAPGMNANVDDSLSGASILNVGADMGNGGFDPLGLDLLGPRNPPAPAARPATPAAPAYRGAESDHASPERHAFPVPPARPSAPSMPMAIPDDYDPLADFLPPRIAPAAPPVYASPPVQASQVPPPVPALFPAEVSTPESDDAPTLLNPAISAAAPPAAQAEAPSAPQAPAAFLQPVQPVPSAPPAATPSPASRDSAARAADDPVIQALMRGLGLTELGGKRSAEEVAELAGAMLREATAGTMGVLLARAMTKRESRLEMTMISAQANNPLKFFPDADSALMQMMNAAMPGYMQPVKAYTNAFDDLKAHELAIMAGMRAALQGVLTRFDPAVIEQRLQVPTVMDKMLSSNRKAKMWDRMVELYQQMVQEADEDFQRLFGETFGDAYEEQIARLQRSRR